MHQERNPGHGGGEGCRKRRDEVVASTGAAEGEVGVPCQRCGWRRRTGRGDADSLALWRRGGLGDRAWRKGLWGEYGCLMRRFWSCCGSL